MSSDKYNDIIKLPYHKSVKYAHMPNKDRAAQFASFAAVTGYDDAVIESARMVDELVELDEYKLENLNMKCYILMEALDEGINPCIEVVHFVFDTKKCGGSYVRFAGVLKKIENNSLFFDGENLNDSSCYIKNKLSHNYMVKISMKNIVEINGELFSKSENNLENI